jgi:hypothetical protein
LKNDLKLAAQWQAKFGPLLQCKGQQPTTRSRPEDWLGTGRACGVGTARWPCERQRGGAASPRAPADKVSQKRRCQHREGGGDAPDEVAVARAHPSSGSTGGGGVEVAQ